MVWHPGNLNLARLSASITWGVLLSLERTEMMIWPMEIRAAMSMGLP
eukprot:CAMPEP_0173176576 /NCGR_PEP_ID=MMETSP1141-20130122/4539_1 /TAXON_ID=483371 /ORGANISM="non described non described, Strain CCMP2298" /LENGTH=46 /DNA_ID= /DNA_START= /DNA_END= /DNA_ORIENTATION=